jgi:hypothetical protein
MQSTGWVRSAGQRAAGGPWECSPHQSSAGVTGHSACMWTLDDTAGLGP